jgi:WD40 repeat protein
MFKVRGTFSSRQKSVAAVEPWDVVAGGARTVEFSRDGRRLVTATVGPALVWDLTTEKLAGPQIAKYGDVYDARFSPGGGRVVTSASGEGSGVWEITTGRQLVVFGNGRRHQPPPAIAFDRDGTHVAAGFAEEGDTQIWELPIESK